MLLLVGCGPQCLGPVRLRVVLLHMLQGGCRCGGGGISVAPAPRDSLWPLPAFNTVLVPCGDKPR